MNTSYYVHKTAEVSSHSSIGIGTKVWNNAQVREGAVIGRNCVIAKDVYIDKEVVIGDYCKIQNGVSIYNGVELEDAVFVGPHVVFTNDLYPRALNHDWIVVPTRVAEGASIGANATILCGIKIGRYAMIAAGSVVIDDVNDFSLVAGNPAKEVGKVTESGLPIGNPDISFQRAPKRRFFAAKSGRVV